MSARFKRTALRRRERGHAASPAARRASSVLVVEFIASDVLIDGFSAGARFVRESDGWRQVAPYLRDGLLSWSAIWWILTEDGSGGSRVRVLSPVEAENDPLFSMRYFHEGDPERGYLWIKMCLTGDQNWRNWHGLVRSDAGMAGSFRIPLARAAEALEHDDPPG